MALPAGRGPLRDHRPGVTPRATGNTTADTTVDSGVDTAATLLAQALNLLAGAALRYRERFGLTDPAWALIGAFSYGYGFLYLLDRADDMIVSGGFNIWPAELETVLADHPAVMEAAVFGIPHERWGKTPMAVVTVSNPDAVTQEALIGMCRERLGSYKQPTHVEITTQPLPKSVVGKLLRKQLREPYWAGHDRRVSGA